MSTVKRSLWLVYSGNTIILVTVLFQLKQVLRGANCHIGHTNMYILTHGKTDGRGRRISLFLIAGLSQR